MNIPVYSVWEELKEVFFAAGRASKVIIRNKELNMSRCELSGKSPVVKNLVSHSNIKTKSVANPNVQRKRIFSKSLNQMVRLYMATSTIRDM